MFFGDSITNTIQRLSSRTKYSILYRPHGSCYDHYIRHIVNDYTDRFFISNKVVVDNAINMPDDYTDINKLLVTRLLAPYNFQICSNVNKNLEVTLASHLPLVYAVHGEEDLVDVENNILGKYPYLLFISNPRLYKIAMSLNIKKEKIFYHPFTVQNNLETKIKNTEKTVDISIFLGGQNLQQTKAIADKLQKLNFSVDILEKNNFSSNNLQHVFERSKIIVELNPYNIYNIIYAINCGTPGIIYTKHGTEDPYIFHNFDEMVSKIVYFLKLNKKPQPIIADQDNSSPINEILANINNQGLIL